MALAPLVMKFGGTSVQDVAAVRRLIGIVSSAWDAARSTGGTGPVVVVSALSRVTDALLAMADRACAGDSGQVERDLDALRARHEGMLELVGAAAARSSLAGSVARQFDELSSLARALGVLGEVSPRSRDAIAAVGELVSSRIVAAALTDAGVPADWVDARQVLVTDASFGSAQPLADDTAERLATQVGPALVNGRVPVIGGYVGGTRTGITTTLGRGGSDYSAAIFGAALGAAEIQIWTDVDGMLTGDPRLVERPRVVSRLSFDEASELAYFGAKVLHPSTILPAVTRDIPVRILNARNPTHPGSRIHATGDPQANGPVAFACKRGVTRIDISSTRMLMAHGFLQRLFEVFARHQTPVDVVTTSEVSVSVTIDDERQLDPIRASLGEFAGVQCFSGRAIVCAVGERMASDPGLSTRVIAALEGLPIEMISQGGSRKNVTVVLPDAHAADAMTRLHARFCEAVDAVPAS
jgi:aspartate kinase